MRLIDELNELHSHYARAIDVAVARNDFAGADRLAQEYTSEAVVLVAQREGKTHLLPLVIPARERPLRRLATRLKASRAA